MKKYQSFSFILAICLMATAPALWAALPSDTPATSVENKTNKTTAPAENSKTKDKASEDKLDELFEIICSLEGETEDSYEAPSYGKVDISKKKPYVAKEKYSYTEPVVKAQIIHNFVNSLAVLKPMAEQYQQDAENFEKVKEKLTDLDKRAVADFADYVKSPDELWNKMKQAANQKYDEYKKDSMKAAVSMDVEDALFLAATSELGDDISSVDDANIQAAFLESLNMWKISKEILEDVYAHQDDWAERTTPQTASLPVWEDQKHIYDVKEWQPVYEQVNAYYGTTGRQPDIGDEKYDYYFYDTVQTAHDELLLRLAAETGKPVAPIAAPKNIDEVVGRPLPPAIEDIVVVPSEDENNPLQGIYTSVPEPWNIYKEDNFKNVSPNGEFSALFDVSENTITVGATDEQLDLYGINKVSEYFLINSEVASFGNGLQHNEAIFKTLQNNIEEFSQEEDLNLPTDFDVFDTTAYDKLKKTMKVAKDDYLKEAESLMRVAGVYPEKATAKDLAKNKTLALYQALKKDTDFASQITGDLSINMEDNMKQTAAINELMNQQRQSITVDTDAMLQSVTSITQADVDKRQADIMEMINAQRKK